MCASGQAINFELEEYNWMTFNHLCYFLAIRAITIHLQYTYIQNLYHMRLSVLDTNDANSVISKRVEKTDDSEESISTLGPDKRMTI